jgi:hypothetical protein
MKTHLYEDRNGIIHLCESSEVHPGIVLVWTVCEKDVPSNKSFTSKEVATCESCLAIKSGGRLRVREKD